MKKIFLLGMFLLMFSSITASQAVDKMVLKIPYDSYNFIPSARRYWKKDNKGQLIEVPPIPLGVIKFNAGPENTYRAEYAQCYEQTYLNSAWRIKKYKLISDAEYENQIVASKKDIHSQ